MATRGWSARLELRFARDATRTLLATRRHSGPLRVQKALYPEGRDVCQAIIVHPPGGIVGGDSLDIDVDVGESAIVQLTTPGAAKWYRSPQAEAISSTNLRVRPGALIEWLPQENLFFDGARAVIRLRVDLDLDARFIGWDVTNLGRIASGESYSSGYLRQSFDLWRDDALIWCERVAIDGGAAALRSPVVLNGAPVFGTLVAAGISVDDVLLQVCREAPCAAGEGAVTRLPDAFVARYRGESAHAARGYFVTLWNLLRPKFVGREAVVPRIWNT